MKQTKVITLIFLLATFLVKSQSLFDKGQLTYFIGAKTVPLKTNDFEDFHISDWESFGLGPQEGRVFVPLASSEPKNSIGIVLGANYAFTEKIEGLIEFSYAPGDFNTTQLLFGANYFFFTKDKFRFGYSGKIGYGTASSNFGEIEILPGKTPPVILSEGTFNEGDDLRMEISTTTIFLGFTSNYTINEKIGLFTNLGYALSIGSKAVIEASETEIPLNSSGIVKPDGSSTQANINPSVKIQGIDLSVGITYNFN